MRDDPIGLSFLMLAAGAGERLGLGPKGFLELHERPLLRWLADKAAQVADEVLVAVPADCVEATASLLPECRVMAGGATRQDSIAVLAAQARGEWLLVHEGARPFASLALFEQVIATARRQGCAGAFLSPVVPVARLRDGRVVEAFAGSEVGIFQTPQVYARADMAKMLQHQATVPGWFASSAIQLALAAGIEVHVVPGEVHNLKITTAEDWHVAQHLGHLLA
ncbi:MAG TPA: 2-C-methyl-D-erythritol 4-phosphate cytidylyltransferase [Thermomonas sp.]|nr:2-C-methyl-D-erythritol 4-phosphate cytidylyltransferase [Thermomonas sp.]